MVCTVVNLYLGQEVLDLVIDDKAAKILLMWDSNATLNNAIDDLHQSQALEVPKVFREFMGNVSLLDVWRRDNWTYGIILFSPRDIGQVLGWILFWHQVS